MDIRLYNLIIDKECPICYNQVSEKDYYITKPCIHLFHNECINNSLKITKNKCPYCNTTIKIETPKENVSDSKSNFLGFINVLGDIFTNITDIDSTNFINDVEQKIKSNEFDEILNELYTKYKKH